MQTKKFNGGLKVFSTTVPHFKLKVSSLKMLHYVYNYISEETSGMSRTNQRSLSSRDIFHCSRLTFLIGLDYWGTLE